MTKKRKLFYALVLLAVIGLAVWGGIFLKKKNSRAARLRENTAVLTVGDISIKVRLNGSVQPRNRLPIKPQVGGRIEEILVSEGQHVRQGEIIAWVSSADRAALLDAARSKSPDEFARWQDAYKPTPVISPIDGFVILRDKEPGQAISASDYIVVMADKLIVVANVDETDLAYIRKGGSAVITLDAYPDKRFRGVVEHIAYESTVVNNVNVYEVKINPISTPLEFRSGMTANVEIVASESKGALLAPIEAVKEKDGRKYVFKLPQEEEGSYRNRRQPQPVEVTTGISDGKNIEIKPVIHRGDEGVTLAEGDRVLISFPRKNGGASSASARGDGRPSSQQNSPARAMRTFGMGGR